MTFTSSPSTQREISNCLTRHAKELQSSTCHCKFWTQRVAFVKRSLTTLLTDIVEERRQRHAHVAIRKSNGMHYTIWLNIKDSTILPPATISGFIANRASTMSAKRLTRLKINPTIYGEFHKAAYPWL